MTSPHTKNAQEVRKQPLRKSLYALLSLLLLAFSIIFFVTEGFGMRVVTPQNSLADYDAVEAYGISSYIQKATSVEQCVQIALKYHIADETTLESLNPNQDSLALRSALLDAIKQGVPDGVRSPTIIKPRNTKFAN